MKRSVRLLGLFTAAMLFTSTLQEQAEAGTAQPVNDLTNVHRVLKLSPAEVKELYHEIGGGGEVGVHGIAGGGLWWGGIWLDVLDTSFLQNGTGETPAQEILRLGTGRCTDESVSTTITLTIEGSRGSSYQAAINSSFGFSASGSRTWTRTERYCGPEQPDILRIFYRQGVYNDHQAVVTRVFFTWNGYLHHWEQMEARVVQVPHPSYPTRDVPW